MFNFASFCPAPMVCYARLSSVVFCVCSICLLPLLWLIYVVHTNNTNTIKHFNLSNILEQGTLPHICVIINPIETLLCSECAAHCVQRCLCVILLAPSHLASPLAPSTSLSSRALWFSHSRPYFALQAFIR